MAVVILGSEVSRRHYEVESYSRSEGGRTAKPQLSETDAMEACAKALEGLSVDEQRRVLEWLPKRLGLVHPQALVDLHQKSVHANPEDLPLADSPESFFGSKKPINDLERIACLAYYLTVSRSKRSFETSELEDLNVEAAQLGFPDFSNSVKNAINVGQYLARTKDGKKMLAARGRAIVLALPDREAVARAKLEHPARKRRAAGKST